MKKDAAQPTKIKTGGSTFKNPKNQTDKKVWELIDSSILNNIEFGDAAISNKHCNFFMNKNNASFNDMKKLINYVKKEVKKKTGIIIELEIVFQLVRVPPNHLLLTKNCCVSKEISFITNEHCFFVPTINTLPDLDTVSCNLTKAELIKGKVIRKSIICILFLTPKIYCSIFGFHLLML